MAFWADKIFFMYYGLLAKGELNAPLAPCVILPLWVVAKANNLQRERNAMNDTIPGNLHVANDVLADMVGNAALECYGVVGMVAPSTADGIAKILPASRLRRGVVVSSTDAGVHVELYVVIEYGTSINTVSQNLVDQVSFVLTEYAQVPLDGVEVHVQGVKVRK